MKRCLAVAVALWAAACDPQGPEASTAVTPGIFADLGEPMPRATEEQRQAFERGIDVALRRFTPEQGLGPSFNVVFCGACHEKPVQGGGGGHYRDFLLTGTRLSDGSYTPAGMNGVQTQFNVLPPLRTATPGGANHTATRNPPPFFGVGLLATVSEEEILSRADPDDADGDGISGRPAYDRGFVGRFGRKAQTVSLEGFVRGPLFNHAGITSNPLPDARKAQLPVPSPSELRDGDDKGRRPVQKQVAAPEEPTVDADDVPDPELSEDALFDLVSFVMLLAPPTPDPLEGAALAGQQHFATFGCDSCHVPALRGPEGGIPAYSDLLLHDMGDELADGVVMEVASGREFRTQPLWGVAAVAPYLHDGRADTLHDAILWHGGEAQASRERYEQSDATSQSELVQFLESLGGASQRTAGLVAPDYQLPPEGQPGAPLPGVDDTEQFIRGLAVFDRDVLLAEGLGPLFNGDGCRACHFDPVPGGAGPSDVDVVRHGTRVDDLFVEPAQGSMAHRHGVDSTRPAVSEDANIWERRQTPSILGLGLLEQVSLQTLRDLEDPDDADGDGVRGRVHLLPDGRPGRLGWKANVPDLAEFARDALSNEVGLTVPADEASPFGFAQDDDDIADPEIDADAIADLVFFMRNLAPPAPVDTAAVEAGLPLFGQVGCATCHVPELPLEDGGSAAAYTDLLLHDVAAADYFGVPGSDAGPREFRTSPLWGLSATAPYMHDGAAATVEQAIALHEAEAAGSRQAYEALSADDRQALLSFLEAL